MLLYVLWPVNTVASKQGSKHCAIVLFANARVQYSILTLWSAKVFVSFMVFFLFLAIAGHAALKHPRAAAEGRRVVRTSPLPERMGF